MYDLLAQAHSDILEAFAHANVLLAFDYDGTLAPIVADPAAARLRRLTRDLLDAAARLYPVVVISGRAQDDLSRRLHGIPLAGVVGNRGHEDRRVATSIAQVRRWIPALEAVATKLNGVTIEDKTLSIAVHYRRSREKKAARLEILHTAAALTGARIIPSKQVVNVLPRDAPHKAITLERERERLGCDTAIYVGDDRADEDVFALDQPGRLLGVRVGRGRATAASFAIADQRTIDILLRALVDHRRQRRQLRRAFG